MKGKNKKKQIAKITVFITSIFVIFMSITYAFVSQVLTGTKEVVINAGVLDLVLEEENEITISDALPMYDQVGMIQENVFEFRLVNNTSVSTGYTLKLKKIESNNELSLSDVKYYLTKDGVGEPKLLSSITNEVVDSGTITGNDTIDYTLRLWIDSNVTDETAILGKSLSYRLEVEVRQEMAQGDNVLDNTWPVSWNSLAVANNSVKFVIDDWTFVKVSDLMPTTEQLSQSYILMKTSGEVIPCDLNSVNGTNETSMAIYGNTVFVLSISKNGYNADLGINIPETGLYVIDFVDSGLSDESVDLEFKNKTFATTVGEVVSDEVLLDDSMCKTYNDGTDTFLVGECQQNYVWYSGKLWKVVLKNNETDAVKMVTNNTITAIYYNERKNTTFEGSYVDQWLNQEFLPTLHDYQDYLVVNSVWDATANPSSTPSRPTYATSVTRTVGLLNTYEYYTTYNKSDGLATASTGYLQNRSDWWFMTPYDSTNVWHENDGNLINENSMFEGYGVRPVVNFKSSIKIKSGTGTLSNPYILEGDVQETINGTTLLNTKYSGEYITFNNSIYRIIDNENGLTKIIAIDYIDNFNVNRFTKIDNGSSNFANSDIKTDLENFYQDLKISDILSFNMIEPNTTWYLGSVGDTTYNYKSSICATFDANTSMNTCANKAASTTANIALPRVGELFASTSEGNSIFPSGTWTLTPSSATSVNALSDHVGERGSLARLMTISNNGARPTMYLKQNVVIASDNTGNGTYEHPYSIELGQ